MRPLFFAPREPKNRLEYLRYPLTDERWLNRRQVVDLAIGGLELVLEAGLVARILCGSQLALSLLTNAVRGRKTKSDMARF